MKLFDHDGRKVPLQIPRPVPVLIVLNPLKYDYILASVIQYLPSQKMLKLVIHEPGIIHKI